MSKILKNYLRNFLKNWIESLNFLTFIVILFCVLFGLIAAPVQVLYNRSYVALKSQLPSNLFTVDNELDNIDNDYFLQKFYYNNPNYTFKDNDIKTGEYYFSYSKNESESYENDIYMNAYIQSYVSTFGLANIKDLSQYSKVLKLIKDDYISKTSQNHLPYLVDLYKPSNSDLSDIYDLSGYDTSKSIPDNIDKSKILNFTDEAQWKLINKFASSIISFLKDNIYYARIFWDSSNYVNYTDQYIESLKTKQIVSSFLNAKKMYSKELNDILYSEFETSNHDKSNYYGDICSWTYSNIINHYININHVENDVSFNISNMISKPSINTGNVNILLTSSDSISYGHKNSRLNKMVLVDGRMPVFKPGESVHEVVLSEAYAKLNNIGLNQTRNYNGLNVKVVGYGIKPIYQFPYDFQILSQNISDYGFMFMPNDTINYLKDHFYNQNNIDNSELCRYNSAVSFSFKNGASANDVCFDKNSKNGDDTYFTKNLTESITNNFKESYWFKPMKMQFLQSALYVGLSFILLIMSLLFTNIVIRKELNQSRKQIGIFKSMGYKTIEISWIFSAKVFIVIFLGSLIGYLVSFPLQIYTSKIWQIQTTFYIQPIYVKPLILSIVFLVVPITITLLSLIFNYLYLKENNLSLLNNSRKVKSYKRIYKSKLIRKYSLFNSKKYFKFKLMKNFTLQSLGKYISVCIILFITSLATLAGIEAISVMKQTVYKDLEQYNLSYRSKFFLNPDTRTNFTVPKKSSDEDKTIIPNVSNASSYYDYKDQTSILSYVKDKKTMTINYGDKLKKLLNIIAKEMNNNPNSLILKGELNLSNIDNIKKWIPGVLLFSKLNNITDLTSYDDLVNSIDFTSINPLDDTLIGIKIGAGKANNPFKFFYLNDFTRLFSLLNIYSIVNDVHNSEPKADINKIYKGKIDINESKYWGINDHYDNIYTPKQNTKNLNKNLMLKNSSTDSRVKKLIKTLSNLNNNYKSFLINAILGEKSLNNDQLVTFNSLFYDSNSDVLDYELDLNGYQLQNINNFRLLDFSSYYNKDSDKINLGKYNNIFKMDGITEEQFNKLTKINKDGSLNVLVSNLSKKAENIGDTISTKMLNGVKVKLNVVGTIKSMMSSYNIVGDYQAFMHKFNVKLSKINDEKNNVYSLPLNYIYTNQNVYEGKVDLTSIDNTLRNVYYKYKTINLSAENDKRVVTDTLLKLTEGYDLHEGLINILKSLNVNVDKGDNIVSVQNISNILDSKGSIYDSTFYDNQSCFESKNLKLKGVYEISYRFIFMLYLLIWLISLMICIMFITVVNIIIEESLYSILMLKAIGYKRNSINIMVMGNYIIASFVILCLSWFINLGFWLLMSKIVWNSSHILIDPIPSFTSLIITVAQMIAILLLGYITCDIKNKRSSITRFIT